MADLDNAATAKASKFVHFQHLPAFGDVTLQMIKAWAEAIEALTKLLDKTGRSKLVGMLEQVSREIVCELSIVFSRDAQGASRVCAHEIYFAERPRSGTPGQGCPNRTRSLDRRCTGARWLGGDMCMWCHGGVGNPTRCATEKQR
jgi:hypothetical protein